jgi:hypothetical protein
MCDQLTSCAVRIREPYEVKVWNISGHGETCGYQVTYAT